MDDRSPRGIFLLIILLIVIFSNSNENQQAGPAFRLQNEVILNAEWAKLNALNHSSYGDFDPATQKYLNITGLGSEGGYPWAIYQDARERALNRVEYALRAQPSDRSEEASSVKEDNAFYKNITGVVRGDWERYGLRDDVPRSALNLTAVSPWARYTNKEFDRNISLPAGSIRLEFDDHDNAETAFNGSVREVRVKARVEDDAAWSTRWDMILHGVHYVDSGHLLLATTSEKFAGIFGLPHFALSEDMFTKAQQLLNSTLSQVIQHQDGPFGMKVNPWSSLPEHISEGLYPDPHCEFVVYIQQHPRQNNGVTATYLESLEHELRFPSGAPYVEPPDMVFSMTAFSPDCGFILESKGPPEHPSTSAGHLKGPKDETFVARFRRAVEMYCLVVAGQTFLLMRQIKETSTPSTRSRVSYYTIAIPSLGDACMAVIMLAIGMSNETIFHTMFAAFFVGFASVVYLATRFLLDIGVVQFTERLRQRRQITPSTETSTTAASAPTASPTAEALPLPATAPRPTDTGATPIFVSFDQDVQAEIAAADATPEDDDDPTRRKKLMHIQFFATMFAITTMTAFASAWPRVLRSWYNNGLLFIYLSLWIPQIHRNIIRNCRKALRWDFVIGQSILRLLPITYLYTIKDNVLSTRTDTNMLLVFYALMWLQILALLSQEILGPRFFVPEGWAPPAYDYHPLLREDEEGANLPIGSTEPLDESGTASKRTGETKEKGKRVYDCTICAQDVEVPIVAVGESADNMATNLLARRMYMVTPCKHIFHTQCLEGWMRYRLQCPNCRETLPPL